MRALTLTFTIGLLFGCGAGVVHGGGEPTAQAHPLDAAPTLQFTAAGITAPALEQGSTVQVTYDAARLPDCRGDQYGQPAWSITAFWRIAGGPIGSFGVAGYSPSHGSAPAQITLDRAGDLELWFQVSNVWGCSAWDSDYGRNFHFAVAPPSPHVAFNADFSLTQSGPLRAGGAVVVDYALARLPRCRQTYNGLPTWEVLMAYRFDGGPVQETPVTQLANMERVTLPVRLAIPAAAHDLELWFHNTDRAGCSTWDSAYGQNFHLTIP